MGTYGMKDGTPITASEDAELFSLQQELICDEEMPQEEKLIRLAILQTLTPIEDWESGAETVRAQVHTFSEWNLLISAYIAVEAYAMVRYDGVETFMRLLDQKMDLFDPEERAVACYIKYLYEKESAGDRRVCEVLLRESIRHCDRYAMHYEALAGYVAPMERDRLLELARANIRHILTEDELMKLDARYFCEPKHFAEEWMTRVIR